MFWMEFNNERTEDYDISVVKRPDIPCAERDRTTIEVLGRDGELHVDNKRYKAITINVELNYMTDESNVREKFTDIKKWLNGAGKLKFSDADDYFYKVYYVKLSANAITLRRTSKFTASFQCEPYLYTDAGQREVINPIRLYNAGYLAKPIFKIFGEGMCTLKVNGKSMSANIGQNLTIDTDKMIAYRTDGTIMNTSVTGNYDELYLSKGENTISITNGFELRVVPGWRYV